MSETQFGMSRAEFGESTNRIGEWFSRWMPSVAGPRVERSPLWKPAWFSKRAPSFKTADLQTAQHRVELNSSSAESAPEQIPTVEPSSFETDTTYYDEYWLAPLVVLVGIVWLRLALDAMGILPLNLGY